MKRRKEGAFGIEFDHFTHAVQVMRLNMSADVGTIEHNLWCG